MKAEVAPPVQELTMHSSPSVRVVVRIQEECKFIAAEGKRYETVVNCAKILDLLLQKASAWSQLGSLLLPHDLEGLCSLYCLVMLRQ